jgi:cell division protein FtsA
VGGASQLDGLADVAADILKKKVRIGGPIRVAGLAESTGGPAYAACAGLLIHAAQQATAQPQQAAQTTEVPVGRLGRIGSWIRENF